MNLGRLSSPLRDQLEATLPLPVSSGDVSSCVAQQADHLDALLGRVERPSLALDVAD